MNNLLSTEIPPNIQLLQRVQNDIILAKTEDVSMSEFQFYLNPFTTLLPKHMYDCVLATDSLYGFTFQDDDLTKRAYVTHIAKNLCVSRIFLSLWAVNNKIRDAYVMKEIVTLCSAPQI